MEGLRELPFSFCRIEILCHDINVHIPHHISSRIPSYNLREAHKVLQENWGEVRHNFSLIDKTKTVASSELGALNCLAFSLTLLLSRGHLNLTVSQRGQLELASDEDDTDPVSCV